MVRLINSETIAIKKIALYIHGYKEKGACHAMGAIQGSTRVRQKVEGAGEET